MARTTNDIYNSIVAEKNAMTELNALQPNVDSSQTLLNDVTSTSKVAEWRLWIWIVATAIHTLETLMDFFKKEVQDIVAVSEGGTLNWYLAKCFDFRYGYQLTENTNGIFEYPTLTTAQIESASVVKRASVQVVNKELVIKVAGENGSGEPIQLPTDQFNAFQTYMRDYLRYPGTQMKFITGEGDQLKIVVDVYYNPLIMGSDGTLLISGEESVKTAIDNYLKTIDFNGKLVVNKLIDAIQNAEGVVNPVVSEVSSKYSALQYAIIEIENVANDGYYILNTDDSQINYIPYVPN